MDKNRIHEILAPFAEKRILVVGDMMLDEYVWGRVSRISPEAPVMVVDADHHTYVPGGAANVVNNLCALGAKAAIVGLIGQDSAGTTLREKLMEEGAEVSGLISTPLRPTTLKTRIIAHSQQVVRVDHEKRDPVNSESQAKLLGYLETAIPACDALLFSDYQKGLLGRGFVKSVVEIARRHSKVITGNIKPQGIGPHCRLTMLTMNHFEAGSATGYMLADSTSEGTLRDAGRTLLKKTGADHVLITRREHGLTLFSSDGRDITIPPHTVEVYDSAGAGDTVISTLTLALVSGATPAEAVILANAAGAVVVKKVGVATVSCPELAAMAAEED